MCFDPLSTEFKFIGAITISERPKYPSDFPKQEDEGPIPKTRSEYLLFKDYWISRVIRGTNIMYLLG